MSAESSATTRWGLIGAVVALVLIIIFSTATLISVLSSTDNASGQEIVEDSMLPRDQRTTARDQIGRTVYSPLTEGGDIFEPIPGIDKNSRSYFTFRPDVEWQRLSGLTKKSVARDYPFSAVAGPWEVTDGIAHNFARSPQGAALAGIHMLNGLAQGGERAAKATIRFIDDDLSIGIGQGGQQASRASLQFLSDPAAKEAPQYMLDNPDGIQSPEAPWTSTFAAYTVLSYDDNYALIRYASPSGDGYLQLDASLVWQDGDWKFTPGVAISESSAVTESEVQTWEQL